MGKGGEKNVRPDAGKLKAGRPKAGVQEEPWTHVVRIDNVEYDITNFIKRHPGGSVIRHHLASKGADATSVYHAMHYRSKKSDLVLKTLPKRQPLLQLQPGQLPDEATKEGEMLRDFKEFEAQLKRDGLFEPSLFHDLYRLFEVAVLFCAGLYLFSLGTGLSIVAGVLVHGIFGGRCGWIQHEVGHGSTYFNKFFGKQIQHLTIGFGLGAASNLWNDMHQKHHASTQKVNHDLDIDTTPVVAFFDSAFEKSRFGTSGFKKWWIKHQHLTFLPITSGVFVMGFWLLFLHPRSVVRKSRWVEGLWMILGHIVRTALFQHFTGWESLLASYAVGYWACMWVSGVYLFGHFSLSHTHLDIVEQDEHLNWVRYAVDHTVDIAPENPLVSWIMGYLNLQVIHHCFPQQPQYHQVETSRRFKQFAEKHGLEYKTMGYFEAWGAMLGNLKSVGEHYDEHGVQSVKSE